MSEYEATKVSEMLYRLRIQNLDRHTAGTTETVEEYTRRMVEQGTFMPEGEITAELSLTLRERLTGTREQNMTAMFIMGAIVGAALEQDVPTGGTKEDAWRDGKFELPEVDE